MITSKRGRAKIDSNNKGIINPSNTDFPSSLARDMMLFINSRGAVAVSPAI
jgi:hypothetical protein